MSADDPIRKWTQEEINTLHEMLQEYVYAKRLGKTVRWAFIWAFGIPAAALAFWDSVEKLVRIVRGG